MKSKEYEGGVTLRTETAAEVEVELAIGSLQREWALCGLWMTNENKVCRVIQSITNLINERIAATFSPRIGVKYIEEVWPKNEHVARPVLAYQTEEAAGIDLPAGEDIELGPGERGNFRTGIKLEIPKGYEVQIRPRSGHAYKYGVTINNSPGTIDSDFKGEIVLIMVNHAKDEVCDTGDTRLHRGVFRLSKGERAAQMVVSRVARATLEEVEELSKSARGEAGFGSSGI